MHLDVLDLRDFYYRTRLGRAAQRAMREQVLHIWPEARRQTVLGAGFAVPLMRPYLSEARRMVGLMPGQQGVMHWPHETDNVSVLCEETRWPLPDGIADKLMLLHALETSSRPDALLEECVRVLGPGGRALFLVPNRRGLWARREGTPFGVGRPYTLGQLEAQLERHGLVPERHFAALFFPPAARNFWLRTAPAWERAGRRVSSYFAGGVLLVEARPQAQASTPSGLGEAVRRPLRVLEGAKPKANPV